MANEFARFVRSFVDPLSRRVRIMVSRAVLELVDDSLDCQSVQATVRADEVRDDVESFQGYGFTSVPPVGAEGVILNVGGSSDHAILVATADRRYRPTGLSEGEVALWTRDHGLRAYAKADGTVNLGTSPTDYVALSSLTNTRIAAVESKLNTLIGLYNAHVHPTGVGPSGITASQSTVLTAGSSTAATEVLAK